MPHSEIEALALDSRSIALSILDFLHKAGSSLKAQSQTPSQTQSQTQIQTQPGDINSLDALKSVASHDSSDENVSVSVSDSSSSDKHKHSPPALVSSSSPSLSLDIPISSSSSSASYAVSDDEEFLFFVLMRCLSVLWILQTVPSLRETLLAGDCSVLINRYGHHRPKHEFNTQRQTNNIIIKTIIIKYQSIYITSQYEP
jgi:hypothetical protein